MKSPSLSITEIKTFGVGQRTKNGFEGGRLVGCFFWLWSNTVKVENTIVYGGEVVG